MKARMFFAVIVVCFAVALASSISSQKVLSQNPTPPGAKVLPAGFTIPPADVHLAGQPARSPVLH
jgi:hypothetical protein